MRPIVIPVLLLVAATASAQEAAAPAKPAEAVKPAEAAKAPARQPRIAVIDMQRISNETLLGKSYQAQLETLKNEIDAEAKKKQSELEKMDAQMKTLQEELEKQASVLSAEAAEKKTQEIKRRQRDRQAYLEDGQAELQRMRDKARVQAEAFNNDFQQRIKPQIDAVAKERGVDILLDSQVAITVSKEFDISQDVVVKSDDAERAARAKAAAAKPAAPAAPKPSPAASPNP